MVAYTFYRLRVYITLIQIWKIKMLVFKGFVSLGCLSSTFTSDRLKELEGPEYWFEKLGFIVLRNYFKSLNWGMFTGDMYRMNRREWVGWRAVVTQEGKEENAECGDGCGIEKLRR